MTPLHLDLTDYRSMEVLEGIAKGIADLEFRSAGS